MGRPNPAATFSQRLSKKVQDYGNSVGINDSTKVNKAMVPDPGEIEDNPSTYYESAKGVSISAKRALQEVKNHGADAGEFLKDMGNKTSYMAHHVLDWLGY